ncbi:MAG: Maf family protein, partial [Mariprofundaceae bacterium]|nr:Maf family protein [Mariprofundaceae bacterium]
MATRQSIDERDGALISDRAGLILASNSAYRRQLLERLNVPFTCIAPDFEEASPGSMPVAELVRHNTQGK